MPNIFRFKIDKDELLLNTSAGLPSLLLMAAIWISILISSVAPAQIAFTCSVLFAILSCAILGKLSLDLDRGETIIVYDKKTKEMKHVFENYAAFKSVVINPFKINIFKNSIKTVKKIEDDVVSMLINTMESDKKLNIQIKFTKQITDFDLYIKNQKSDFKAELIETYNKTCEPHDFSEDNDLSASNKRVLADIVKNKYAEVGFDLSSVKIKTEVVKDNWSDVYGLNETNSDQSESAAQIHNKKRYISLS